MAVAASQSTVDSQPVWQGSTPHGSASQAPHVGQLRIVVEVVLVVSTVVLVVMVSQTLAVQTCPDGQLPQFSVLGQLPLSMRPHWPAAHVVAVQHIPNGLLPGGWLLMQILPQQL